MDVRAVETTDAVKYTSAGALSDPLRLDEPAAFYLPCEPFVVIEPQRSWLKLRLKELWDYRELLYFLAWRDIKVRYKQTALGVTWAVLQPLLAMAVFTLIFGRLEGATADGLPYPLFAYSGLLLWVFFANAVTNSGNSLVTSSNLITKVYFPRMIIPAAAVAAGTLDFVLACVLLVPLALWYGVGLSANMLLAPAFVLLTMLCALGVGLWMSALNVKYRDVRHALPFAVQLWMFVSSVIAPSHVVPAKFRWLLFLNPLTGIIENFRAALFGRAVNWTSLAVALAVTLGLFVSAMLYFRRVERSFADVV